MFAVNYIVLYVSMKSWRKLPEVGDIPETLKS